MAPVSNRFAKYIIQPDTAGGGSAPAPKANRFAKYKAGEAPAVQQANPMVAQGQAAQREYEAAGSPELPADNTVRMPAARDPLAPRAGEEWRKIDRSAQPAPQSPFYPKEAADRLIAATAEANKAKRENEEYRARRGPVINAISDFLIGGLNAGDQALYSAADAGLNAIDPERRGAKAVRESLLPFAGLRENNDIVRAIPEMAAGIAENPASGAATVVEGMEPTHMIARGGNNLRDAGRAALQGDFKEAQAQYSEATPDLLFGTLGVTPFESMAVSAAKRGVAAPGEALRAQMGRAAEGFRQFDAPAVVEPPKAMFANKAEYSVATQDSGTFGVSFNRTNDGGVVIFHDKGTIEYKPEFAKGKSDEELLAYTFEPLGFEGATKGGSPSAATQPPVAPTAPAPVQGRSDAAIGAAKQQAETRAQLQAALDAANARGDREAAAQLESQLRDSTFIIDPQTGQRAGAATRAAQPQPIPTATQTAAGAPPIQPPPPAVASANAAVPTPGVVPPAGNLVPIPQNEAVAAFNALPPKTREAMLRTLNSAGMDANGFWSDTWRKLTGRFRNSSEAMDAIRKLGDMPEDQQVMFALQLIKNNGGDLETILPAMGRKWATEGARDPQLFGGTDRAREIMDANVPKVINSQGERVAGIAEDKFGPGIVPAGEAIDVEKRVLAKQYDTLLNPQRKQYGRLRNPQKLASIDKAWNDIKAYLKRPEVIDQMPDWVKLKVMQRASEDMRNIGFTDAEMSTILAGDGAVLAPLFEASGPLTWSPQMWTHLVDQYPTQAAHVLQSAYREAADGLMSGVSRTQADVTNAQYLMRLRGESGKGGLVDMLERAIPGKGGKIDGEGGYQWTRTNFGDNRSAERAFDILERFKTAANSEGDVAAIIKELKDLPARHREAAENQITSLIRQELGRKVDNVKLSELDNPDRLSAPNLTALSNQNFLNALEDVFGPRGKELADGIRLARASTDTLTSISPKYNSRTQLNAEDVKNAGARYEDPAGAEGGVIDKTVGGLASGGLATGGAAALGISAAGGLTVPLLGLAAGKALYNAYKAGKRLSNTERNQLVDFLFRARKAGEGDPLPRKINHGNVLRSAAVNAAVGGTIGGLSSEGDPNAIAAGIVGGAGFGAARKIIRSRSSLIKPPGPVGPRRGPRGPATPVNALRGPGGSTPPSSPTNALSTPPRPPVKAGFGGSKQPLPMDEASRMGMNGGPVDEFTSHRLKRFLEDPRPMSEVLQQGDYVTHSGSTWAVKNADDTYLTLSHKNSPDTLKRVRRDDPRLDVAPHEEWPGRPAEAGSSKLLAGMGGSEGASAFGGAAIGAGVAPDTNDDGVVDAQERAAGAFGGALSGIVGAKAVRAGGNALAKAGKVAEEAPLPLKKQLGGPTPNALSTPPRPPVKAGFGGSSKPPPMDEGARLPERGYEAIRIGPATVEITRVGDEATINRLKVPEGERGKGAASRALDAVLRQADAEGVTLFLTPERIGDSGLSDAQLKAFYTRHGFASNRGRDRSFSTMATMVRKPRAPKSGSSKPLDMSEAGRMQRAREEWGGGADVVGREQASKYKFQTGKPVVVEGLHGTRGRDIKEFDLDEAGSNFSQDEGTLHFSDSADDANAYATSDTTGMPATDGAVYPVYIRMRNPLVADSEFFKREGMGDIFKNEDRISAWDAYHPFLKERAEELGADGIILKDSFGRSHYISFDPKNIRGKFAKFDPAEAGSSKLLAGMGGRVSGQLGPPAAAATIASVGPEGESNEDKLKRMATWAAAASGVRNAGALKRIGGGVFKPQTELMSAKGSYGSRPSAMGDLTGHQAAQKQLKELEAYRKTAPASEHAAVDQEIEDIRGFLDGSAAPTQAGFEGPPKPANALKPGDRRFEVNQSTFGGVNAKTADRIALGRAQNMEAEGATRDAIWDATGWFKGNDGKWRFEIDDSGARLRSNEEVAAIGDSMVQGAKDLEGRVKQSNAALREQPDLFPAALKRVHADMRKRAKGMREKANESFGPTWNEYNGRRLEYDLDHPAMIAAYPQLARDLVISRPGPSQFSPGLMGSYSDSRIKLNGPRNSDQTSTTLHETQHALQEMEDFATGGSPESAYMTDGLRREWAQEIDKILTPAPFEKFAANSVWDGVPEAEVRRQYKAMVDEMRAASKDIYHPLSKTVQHTAAYNIYKRLAGETEARNVQTRRDFTPEERRARPPWTTQDVPDDQQIVRYGAGKQESRPPKPSQAGFSFGGGKGPPQPQANALASPPKKPRPVEARREAPRGNKPFNNPSLSQGENKISEMLLNGYEYPAIADEMMTSVDVVKQLAKRAQDKLGDAVKLPRPGMGKRPVGSTKREAAFGLFDEGLDNATIAQRTGLSIGNVRTYRSYWKEQSNAPVASVEGAAYNPPAMPERPFEADYPQQDWPDGPPVDAQGRLTRDRDGRPLDQTSVIIGRNKAPGYGPKSEADRSLRDRIAVIQTLKKAGSSLKRVPRSPDQTSGAWLPKFNDKDRYTGRGVAQITDDLDRPIAGLDDQEVITLSHELAHSIDFKTRPASDTSAFNNRKWGIDHKNPYMTPEVKAELESQLQRIYQDLNNPIDGEVKIRTPKDHGYESIDADRELWAEAIRAYMYDPNYIKTVAPDVAFMIRDNVNKNGSLRKTIQFNAIPTIVGVGGLGLGAAALNGQPAEAKTRSSGMRANALAPAQNNRP